MAALHVPRFSEVGSSLVSEVSLPLHFQQPDCQSQSCSGELMMELQLGAFVLCVWKRSNGSVSDVFLLSFFHCIQGDIGESEAKGSMMKPSAFAITHGTAGSCTRFLPSLSLLSFLYVLPVCCCHNRHLGPFHMVYQIPYVICLSVAITSLKGQLTQK